MIQVLSEIEPLKPNHTRRTCYLCHPVTGLSHSFVDGLAAQGVKKADEAGFVPLSTWAMWRGHLTPDNKRGYDAVMRKCLTVVDLCDELWVLTDYLTPGMITEIERATSAGKPVKFYLVDPRVHIRYPDTWEQNCEGKDLAELEVNVPEFFTVQKGVSNDSDPES